MAVQEDPETTAGTRRNGTADVINGSLRFVERLLLWVVCGLCAWTLQMVHTMDVRLAVMENWMEHTANHSAQMDQLLTETVQKWAEGEIDHANLAGEMKLIRQRMGQMQRALGAPTLRDQ